MASTKISQLPQASAIGGGDLFPIVQNGETKKISWSDMELTDVTSAEIYNLSINGELIQCKKYRITDYKSVNWLNGYWNADYNNAPFQNLAPYSPVNTNLGAGATGGANGTVCLAKDTISTGVYIGGTFDDINGSTPSNFQKLNVDGTPNTSFNSGYFTGAGFNNSIQSIAVQTDGKVLVGGVFTQLNGVTRNCLVRLNTDGTVDSAFYTNLGTAFDGGVVSKIIVQPDGKIIVAGSFTNFNGATRNGLTRLNSNGTEDTIFATNIGTGAGGLGLNGALLSPNGKIYVQGGDFATWNGNPSQSMARLNSDGTFDNTFVSGFPPGFKGAQLYHEMNNGDLLISYTISWAGSSTNAQKIIRVSNTGSLVGYFGNVSTGGGSPNCATTLSDNGVIIGGPANTDFNGYATGIAKYDQNGVLDTSYNPGSSFDQQVYDIAEMDEGNYLLVLSGFGEYQGNASPKGIVALKPFVSSYDARESYVSSPEVLVVTAINGSEVDPMGYSETWGDTVTYIPYFNALGIVTDFDNGTTLSNGQVLSGFDLQWDSTENVAYCTMPEDYPVRFGNYFYIEFNTSLPSTQNYIYLVIEPVKPGLNYSMDYDPEDIQSSVLVSTDGLTVKFPDVTFAQYQAYVPDSLYAETVEKFHDAYGFVQWRKDPSRNIVAPFDWRNYKYRRYELTLPSPIGGTYWAGTTDTDFSGTPTGNYIDVAPFGGSSDQYVNQQLDPDMDGPPYYFETSNVVFNGSPGAINYYYWLGTYDNIFVGSGFYDTFSTANYVYNLTFLGGAGRSTFSSGGQLTNTFCVGQFFSSTIDIQISNCIFSNTYGCNFRNGYYSSISGAQFGNMANVSFEGANINGDKTGINLNDGYTKSVILATDNQNYLIKHDGTNFVSTSF